MLTPLSVEESAAMSCGIRIAKLISFFQFAKSMPVVLQNIVLRIAFEDSADHDGLLVGRVHSHCFAILPKQYITEMHHGIIVRLEFLDCLKDAMDNYKSIQVKRVANFQLVSVKVPHRGTLSLPAGDQATSPFGVLACL